MNSTQIRYFDFDEFRLDTLEQKLFRDGEKVPLTFRSFQLLRALVSRNGQLVRHEDLLREVWQETTVDQSSLKQNIALIRKALGEAVEKPRFIQTVPKFGYRFVAKVQSSPDDQPSFIAERQRVTEIEIEEKHRIRPNSGSNRPALLILGILTLTALVTSTVAIWFYANGRGGSSNDRSFAIENIVPKRITNAGNIANGVLSADGRFIAYSDSDDVSASALFIRPVDAPEPSRLVTLNSPEGFGAYTFTNDGKWIYYVVTDKGDWGERAQLFKISIFGGKPHRIMGHIDSFVTFSPDDSRMVFNRFSSDGSKLITASTAEGSDERQIAQGKTNLEFLEPKWSPDGKEVLYFSAERRTDGTYWSLATISVDGDRITTILPPARQRIWHISWAGDGNVIINAADPVTKLPQLYLVDRRNGETRRLTNDLYYYSGVSFGGGAVLSTKQERPSAISIADPANPASEPRRILGGSVYDSVSWAPDGNRLIYVATDDGRRHIWSMDPNGENREMISKESADEVLPDVSPDGGRVVFISNRTGTYEIWTSKIDGSEAARLTSGNSRLSRVQFAPDGQSVYFSSVTETAVRLARVGISGENLRIVLDDADIGLFAVSPDGSQVAYSTTDAKSGTSFVVLRNLESGQILRKFDISPTRFLKFSAAGDRLLFKNSNTVDARISSVWIQPLDGSKARQLIDFKTDDVFDAELSPDGRKIAVVRGKLTSDLILLSSRWPADQ